MSLECHYKKVSYEYFHKIKVTLNILVDRYASAGICVLDIILSNEFYQLFTLDHKEI